MSNPAIEDSLGAEGAISQAPKVVTTKFIVAVHGIGDQTMFGTIKSAAFRFFSYRAAPADIPLGSFHTDQLNDVSAPFLDVPVKAPEIRLRFAEAYWAAVPRDLVRQGFTLEESKHWAQTVVERFRARYERKQDEYNRTQKEYDPKQEEREPKQSARDAAGSQTTLTRDDFAKVKQILLEMIESIRIIERLVTLAEKAGLFKFNLGKLLDDYVGDVQIVADFQKPRSEILSRFLDVMRAVYAADPTAEIYIVAHSEGTVVSFLGLLTGMRDGGQDDGWVRQVRGLMTIGSPLDKHLLLWPALFKPFELPKDEGKRTDLQQLRVPIRKQIQWKNYYDYGDPIGFNLRKIREWIAKTRWTESFKFEDVDDYEFSRYFLPGKAHTDYWQDKNVFGHFIQTVVDVPPKTLQGTKATDFSQPPQTKLSARIASYGFPYLLFAVLLFAAVFILRKGVLACISPEGDPASARRVLMSVGLSALGLSGLTAMAGIFRLTRLFRWRIYGASLFVLLAIPYWRLQWPDSQARHFVAAIIADTNLVSLVSLVVTIISTTLLVLLANWVIKKKPSWGLKPLLLLLGAPVAAVIWTIVHGSPDRDSLWPLFLSGAGALYLWWLAALLFDLVFIWHYYIRHEAAINSLREPTLSNSKRAVTDLVAPPKAAR